MKLLILITLSLAANVLAASKYPGLVRIRSFAKETALENTHQAPTNQSLGFVIERDGFLLTNYKNLTHPETGALLDEIHVEVSDKNRTYSATIIGVEPTINLGILKISGAADEIFETAKVARCEPPAVGAPITAIAKLEEEIQGSIAGLNSRECYQESLTSTMFRAHISIPSDSIGGPIFSKDGGHVLAIFTGFQPTPAKGHTETNKETHLLPINLCLNVYESIKQKGSMKSPWTGFSVRALSAEQMKFFPTEKKHQSGVHIEHIWPGGPAEKLGLKQGDILVQFSYNRIESVADFQKWLYMFGVGQSVKLMILRDGKEYRIADYVIEERPSWAKPK